MAFLSRNTPSEPICACYYKTASLHATIERKEVKLLSEPNIDHIMQVGLGFWASKTLLSAIEIGLFTELAKHPEDLSTLTGTLGLHPRSARDFFDALVALGFLG